MTDIEVLIAPKTSKPDMMLIAVEGCSHGELDEIYKQVKLYEDRENQTVDLLLLCGDFQAVRNVYDMQCMAVPDKYKDMRDFHRYYSGEKTAPVLTLVIGGNHEASNYMWELYHGGWLAPNIYFLGHSGVVNVNGLRIAAASGIFKGNHFAMGHFERMPYDKSAIRSIYHIREYSVRKLSLISPRPDIFLSHDWPSGIEQHGNLAELLRRKPFFKQDIQTGNLGSPPLTGLLHNLQPHRWFSAHLHTRFEAHVKHNAPTSSMVVDPSPTPQGGANPDEIAIDDDDEPTNTSQEAPVTSEHSKANPDEITLSDEEGDVQVAPPPPLASQASHETCFIALDKCLPKRRYIEFIDVPTPTPVTSPPTFTFNNEWLAICKAFHPYLSLTSHQLPFPSYEDAQTAVRIALEELGNVERDVRDVQQFVTTAPPQKKGDPSKVKWDTQQPPSYRNPQTDAWCAMVGVENRIK
ncbi:Metallo-dependent phosphatase-like protein [Flagelloscypha sp. PMI_526]|nr:Metallo-dependent phosphatase-like protein [Flagelloscypha sp. PMI_526]